MEMIKYYIAQVTQSGNEFSVAVLCYENNAYGSHWGRLGETTNYYDTAAAAEKAAKYLSDTVVLDKWVVV